MSRENNPYESSQPPIYTSPPPDVDTWAQQGTKTTVSGSQE